MFNIARCFETASLMVLNTPKRQVKTYWLSFILSSKIIKATIKIDRVKRV